MKTITFSALRTLWDCPRRYYWRYVRELVPRREDDAALRFGSLIHGALELHWKGESDAAVLAWFDAQPVADPYERARARAMLRAYLARWGAPPAGVVAVERVIGGRILTPEVRGWRYAGKVDAVQDDAGALVIHDHKTASQTDGTTLERLWTDAQLSSYALYLSRETGRRVRDVGHDILTKPALKVLRRSDRPRKLKADGTPAADASWRAEDETPDEHEARCSEWYEAHPEAFIRERIILSDARVAAVETDLAAGVATVRHCEARGHWPQHWTACYQWQRRCPYAALCESGDSPIVLDNDYHHKPAHEELRTAEAAAAQAPLF